MTSVGVVIPVAPCREENLRAVLGTLEQQTVQPDRIVIVFDGPEAVRWVPPADNLTTVGAERFIPGQTEQLRNVGARTLDTDAVWFVDSDILLDPVALEAMLEKWRPGRVVIGAYDWMGPGRREPDPENFSDPRWEMFREERWADPEYASTEQLNVGLACFGGNLMWDREEFERLGGFWNEVHRGEDGELGLRAVAHGVPIQCAPRARGYHMWHPVDIARITRENERNIPMIDARHPWIKGEGVLIVERDGKRFEQTCGRCGESVSTIEYYAHQATCR